MWERFSESQVSEILAIQKDIGVAFPSTAAKQMEDITKTLPIVRREQCQLLMGFCLYKIHKLSEKKHQPGEIRRLLNFHDRLFADVATLSHDDIVCRWTEFQSKPFITALETAAHGEPELVKIVSFVKSKCDGRGFLEFHQSQSPGQFVPIIPSFMQFVSSVKSDMNLITDAEYDHARLYSHI